MIRLIVPFTTILFLPFQQTGCAALIVHIPSEPTERLTQLRLPRPAGVMSAVIRVRQEKPHGGTTVPCEVNIQRLLAALDWCCRNNALYAETRNQLRTNQELAASVHEWREAIAIREEPPDAAELHSRMLSGVVRSESATEGGRRIPSDAEHHDQAAGEAEEAAGTEEHGPDDDDDGESGPHAADAAESQYDDDHGAEDQQLEDAAAEEGSMRTMPPLRGNPVPYSEHLLEAKAYPHLFPRGAQGSFEQILDDLRVDSANLPAQRQRVISQQKYCLARLCGRDNRFQADLTWVHNWLRKILSKRLYYDTNVILERSTTIPNDGVTAEQVLRAIDSLGEREPSASFIWRHAYRRLGRDVPGSVHFWAHARSLLHAMVRHVGPPSLFLTLSADDMHWPDLFAKIDPQRFADPAAVRNLSSEERQKFIRDHPAIVARHFFARFQALFHFINESRVLGGPIREYFYRIEFQERGSPHVHALLWIDGAPNPPDALSTTDPREFEQQQRAYIAWVDSVIQAYVPDNDSYLAELVERLQRHTHSATCKDKHKKRGRGSTAPTAPAAPGPTALREGVREEASRLASEMRRRQRENCRFGYPHPCSAQTVFRSGMRLRYMVRGDRDIIFKRPRPGDAYIAPYNPDILRIWQANMDLQPIANPYAAIRYITAYGDLIQASVSYSVLRLLRTAT